jgi:hypothetical protein
MGGVVVSYIRRVHPSHIGHSSAPPPFTFFIFAEHKKEQMSSDSIVEIAKRFENISLADDAVGTSPLEAILFNQTMLELLVEVVEQVEKIPVAHLVADFLRIHENRENNTFDKLKWDRISRLVSVQKM